ncbi:adenosine deaminase [Desulforamulus profundi]|uniref:tRNA-specific adenosine deaminase n=1 Tax=Desulforamulus profundi TaxID=1383067 RepID=A0A2C6MF57_9FIRM|nr:tRNA adenosine(34) deaminase TadA [Desulforamulus profundi]PHJ38023.1 adenosine deaminase [Desulforamulus profundi]
MSHASYMREALSEARKAAEKGEVPIGAVVVVDGKIIGRGHDLRESICDASAHAEILAMREAAKHLGDWRLNNATLYVTVEPCAMCAGAIVQFRIKRLVYGAPNAKSGSVDTILDIVHQTRFNHRVEVISGILEDECREILQKFFRELRKK